jgi:hypothetical protein
MGGNELLLVGSDVMGTEVEKSIKGQKWLTI